MDKGAWLATVHRVTKSQTELMRLSTHAQKALTYSRAKCVMVRPAAAAKSLQSCLTLCDPMDCSTPGSFVHRILQARILEWVAMPSSRGSF